MSVRSQSGRFFDMNAYDINICIADEGKPWLVHSHELTKGGKVFEDEAVKVTTALVAHPPVTRRWRIASTRVTARS